MRFKGSKGQGMIEYIIIVSIIAIMTVGIVRIVGQNIRAHFMRIAYKLQDNKKKVPMSKIDKKYLELKEMDDFELDGNTE